MERPGNFWTLQVLMDSLVHAVISTHTCTCTQTQSYDHTGQHSPTHDTAYVGVHVQLAISVRLGLDTYLYGWNFR